VSCPDESLRTPAVVMPSSNGSRRAPDANAMTSHSSRFGCAWTSSNSTMFGLRPSLVYASALSTRYTEPVSRYSRQAARRQHPSTGYVLNAYRGTLLAKWTTPAAAPPWAT
jgi:hypothetical protein